MNKKNLNSILFLYEGDTEREFYNSVFENYVNSRNLRISWDNLKGVSTNINKKVLNKIFKHIDTKIDREYVHVFVAVDREGEKNNDSPIDIDYIMKQISSKTERVKSVNEIIATQVIESWFFIDIEGIYNYLRFPKNMRNPNKYVNYEAFSHRELAQLFRNRGKAYMKGHKAEKFISSLNIKKIYNSCDDLKKGINKIISLLQ